MTGIRQATENDLESIEKIARAAFAIYLPRMDRKPFPMLDDYGAHIAAGHAFVLVSGDAVRAYVILLPQADGALLLDNVGVDPAAQKCGHGAALLAFAEEYGRRNGFDRIVLYTNEAMRENVPWYRKHGYEITRRCVEKGYRRIYFSKNISRP